MQRHLVIVLPALAVVALATAANHGSATNAAIVRAVRAPYEAYFARDAPALCADFIPTVSAQLVANAPAGTTCEAAVAEVFTLTAPYQPRVPAHLPADWTVGHIVQHGALASAVVRYGTEGTASFKLQRIEGKWLIATRSRIITVSACDFSPHPTPCPAAARIMVFLIAPLNPSPVPIPAIPGTVKRIGGHELSEFKAGRTVYDQSGCAACHRIGDQGNKGPGPDLTQVGSTLSTPEIERAIVDPSEPMPSFKNLPAKKFKAIVEFLSLLR
jgi:mono/diheme cytochrome c family protein